jgi:hypothetical protein
MEFPCVPARLSAARSSAAMFGQEPRKLKREKQESARQAGLT